MGTRARVGIQNPDGTIRSMYVCCDGYTKYLGKMLFENYTTVERINDLIDLKAVDGVHKTFSTMRLRGFSKNPLRIETLEDYLNCGTLEDYLYVFIDKEWFYSHYMNAKTLIKITKKLLKDKNIE